MTDFVVDASVIVKWVLAEEDTPRANELLRRDGRLLAPRLARAEAASAVARAHRTGRLERAAAEAAFVQLAALFGGSALTLAPDADLLETAQIMALDLRHPLADCLYLALAEKEKAVLVTADRTFLARARPPFGFVKALNDV